MPTLAEIRAGAQEASARVDAWPAWKRELERSRLHEAREGVCGGSEPFSDLAEVLEEARLAAERVDAWPAWKRRLVYSSARAEPAEPQRPRARPLASTARVAAGADES